MLFTQQNGLAAPATDQSEVDVLQELACGIGPRVDGVAASLALPQAMGGFITQGAAGACAGRNQQAEQHTSTTMHGGFGETATAVPIKLAIDPAKLALIKQASVAPLTTMTATALPIKTVMETMPTKPSVPGQPDLTPAASSPATPANPSASTYPPGTITAFDITTNMWRVAVPTIAAGFGMFDAAAAPFTEVAPVAAPPTGATQVSLTKLEKDTGQLKLASKWWFWTAIAGGVAVLGTTTAVLVYRRRRKNA